MARPDPPGAAFPGPAPLSPELIPRLAAVARAQGRLFGRLEGLPAEHRHELHQAELTADALGSSALAGEAPDATAVRAAAAAGPRTGASGAPAAPAAPSTPGIVSVLLDATGRPDQPLTAARLLGWHAALAPASPTALRGSDRAVRDLDGFVDWFNAAGGSDPIIVAGLAQYRLLASHPFADGNGRIARAVADLALARSDPSGLRGFSLSRQFHAERADYRRRLERMQAGGADATEVTDWLRWFLDCLQRAIEQAQSGLAGRLFRARFWERFAREPLNGRQIQVLQRMLDGFEGRLTTSKWARLAGCSQDTAHRDIVDLVARGAMQKNAGGGRSTSYSLRLRLPA
jgi:Fic family protein